MTTWKHQINNNSLTDDHNNKTTNSDNNMMMMFNQQKEDIPTDDNETVISNNFAPSPTTLLNDPFWENAFFTHEIPTTYQPTSYASHNKKPLLTVTPKGSNDENDDEENEGNFLSIIPRPELFYEGKRNFWKLKRGLTITIWKHVSFNNCLEMIAFDSDDKKMTSINPPIYIDYDKLYSKACSDSFHDSSLHGHVKLYKQKSLQQEEMIKYLMDRLKMELKDFQEIHPRSHFHHSNKNSPLRPGKCLISDFQFSLPPLPGDDVTMIDNIEQVDIVCCKPRELSIATVKNTEVGTATLVYPKSFDNMSEKISEKTTNMFNRSVSTDSLPKMEKRVIEKQQNITSTHAGVITTSPTTKSFTAATLSNNNDRGEVSDLSDNEEDVSLKKWESKYAAARITPTEYNGSNFSDMNDESDEEDGYNSPSSGYHQPLVTTLSQQSSSSALFSRSANSSTSGESNGSMPAVLDTTTAHVMGLRSSTISPDLLSRKDTPRGPTSGFSSSLSSISSTGSFDHYGTSNNTTATSSLKKSTSKVKNGRRKREQSEYIHHPHQLEPLDIAIKGPSVSVSVSSSSSLTPLTSAASSFYAPSKPPSRLPALLPALPLPLPLPSSTSLNSCEGGRGRAFLGSSSLDSHQSSNYQYDSHNAETQGTSYLADGIAAYKLSEFDNSELH